MAHLSLSFLGTFQVTLDQQTISRFRSANVQGLLVYLTIQAERPIAREVLATLFWPDEPDSVAKQNLRQTLYQLRKVLGDDAGADQPLLRVTRQTIQFNSGADYSLDVHQFLTAVNDGALDTAVSLYSDDLLPGFTCDSLEFEYWLRQERERLHGLALQAMSDLAERRLRNGRAPEAQLAARRQLTLEPWSEIAHQHLIEALALAGDRSGALAQFDRCREILADELGVSPSPETISLVERIQNNELRPVDPDLIAGRYSLAEEIGRGAAGIVFRGRDSHTGETVAIKMLDAGRVAGEPGLVNRFLREGEALRKLNHPNIVKLLAMDERDGRHYLVMEYISGGDLRQLLQAEGPLSLESVLTIGLDLADALTRAHRLGILHRDIKPANILLDGAAVPRLTDFGIARLGQDSDMTEEGAVLGTISYMSPEACMGEMVDARADIWSFGVVLYEMLAGERPFSGPTLTGTITHILSAPLPDISAVRSDLPAGLEDLLYRMLARNREERIPSVRLVGAEIEAILQAVPSTTPPRVRSPQATQLASSAFATPTPEQVSRIRRNLPAQSTPFVGRASELTELERLVSDPAIRLVTILGPGGMGKSRLSLEIAGRLAAGIANTPGHFPDGVFFVELDTANTKEQMITAVAGTLGFAVEQEIEPLQQVLDFLSNKQLLLLLDNFEHLLAAPNNGAEAVAAVLQAAPEVKIIATSRQKLNLSSEVLFVLEGMAFPNWQTTADALSYSAVQLFVQSARRVRIDFALDAGALPHVARICRLTEGMPLGIVLAAAWIDMLSLAEIAEEMQADIDFLAGEMGDLPPRQRSMRAVFDYSWALLTEPEQQILARLSVFQGGFRREAAQAVTGATLRQLLALVNKSLIQRDVASGRFTLHDLLRQLAAEKLEALGETDALQMAHSRYYLSWLASHEDDLQRFRQLETVRILRPDDPNIRSAWLWAASSGEANLLLSVIRPYTYYAMLTGRSYEADRLYRQALQRLPAGDPTFTDTADEITFVRASLLNHVQELGYTQDEHGPEIDIDRLYTFFQARGARLEEALVCQHLAIRALKGQDFSQAMAYFQAQAEISEQEDEIFGLPLTLGRMGMLAILTGQIEAGLRFGKRATALAEQYSDQLNKPVAMFLLALYTLFEKNDYVTSQELLAELTALNLESWANGLNAVTVLGSLTYQGFVALLQGQLEQARLFSQKMYELAEIRNSPRDKLTADAFAGLIRTTLGQYEAVDLQVIHMREGGLLSIGPIGVALTAYGQRNIPLAAMTIVKAWSMPIALRWPSILLQFIPVVASILADQGEFARAVALLAMARAHPACPRGWWEIMALVQELEARLQAALSAEEYSAAQAQGRQMKVGQTAVSLIEELKAMVAAEGQTAVSPRP